MEPPDRLELHVRSLRGPGEGETPGVVERFQRIEQREGVEDASVRVWGTEVALSTAAAETEAGREILGRVDALRNWADRAGVSVDRLFEVRRRERRLTGDTCRTLRLPVRVLVEVDDGEITYVTPHEVGDEVVTLTDRLARLAAGRYGRSAAGPVAP
jgi:hypothetical protein